jgi:two-component system sensor histidine kinase TctE
MSRWAALAGRASLRRQLLLGILLPTAAVVALNTVILYRQALAAADTAYDRTLLATAKSIGEQLGVVGSGSAARVVASVPYSALEAFEADSRSRLFYRVLGFAGEPVSGFTDLPPPDRDLPARSVYAALVHFYDAVYRGEPVRMAVLLQPVASTDAQGMATVQVAETLELRQTLARRILVDTVWRQALLLALIAAVVWWVVQRATRPVRALSAAIEQRQAGDLTPIDPAQAPRELLPLLEATNHVMQRLEHLLAHQKRFVRDASHQLRTPLAVLKAQLQSARRGDLPPQRAFDELAQTVDGATRLANQMLALAKVEQLRQQGEQPLTDAAVLAREVALDLAPLAAARELALEVQVQSAPVQAHAWMLRELLRNLLHNAIKHAPPGSPLRLTLVAEHGQAVLSVADAGPGLDPELRERLVQPFVSGAHADALPGGTAEGASSGLGLAICQQIVDTLGGSLRLDNRLLDGRIAGLDAVVRLPLATRPSTRPSS